MEHGPDKINSRASFTLADEDHTLGNSVRYVLNQDPRVTSTGYSIPHPSQARVVVQVQTTGDPAREVLKDACQEMMLMNRHVRSVFDEAVAVYKAEEARKKAEKDAREKAEEEALKKLSDQIETMDVEAN